MNLYQNLSEQYHRVKAELEQKQELIIADRCSFSRVKICVSPVETPRKIRVLAQTICIADLNLESRDIRVAVIALTDMT
jgi:hypothetical protein